MKKLFLILSLALLMCCMLALAVSAAPDESREKVTLTDETVLPLWDEDGSGLIWYINGTDAETGKNTYAYVSNLQKDTTQSVYVKYTLASSTYLNGISIVDNGTTYAKTEIVVANFQCTDENVVFNALNNYMFQNCSKMEYFFAPKQLTKIKGSAFYGCTKLQYCDLSYTNVKSIEGAAFQGATSLEWVSLPSCFEAFENSKNFFNGCTSLERVDGINEWFALLAENEGTIPNGLFYDCTSLNMEIVIPEGIKVIDEYAFTRCSNLNFENLVIPNSVTTLGRSAFNGCTQIKTVRLGASLTSLGQKQFRGCTSLKEIYIPTTLSAILAETFYNFPSNGVFYYAGTKAQLATLVSASETSGNGAFVNATQKSLSEYNDLATKSGRYIVYDYNICDAFYDSECSVANDDFNCETELLCGRGNCTRVSLEAKSHVEAHSVDYENGFLSAGNHLTYCSNENCKALDKTEKLEAMFAPEGFSYRLGDKTGISAKFKINTTALALYETYEKELVFGIIIANQNHVQESFLKDGKLNTANGKGIQVVMEARTYSYFTCLITGFDMSNTQHTELGLVIAGYVHAKDDEENVAYFQKDYEGNAPYAGFCKRDTTLNVVTIGKVKEFSGE